MTMFTYEKPMPMIVDFIAGIDTSNAADMVEAQEKFLAALVDWQRAERKARAEWTAQNQVAIEKGKELYRDYLNVREGYIAEADARAQRESGIEKYAADMNMEVKDFRAKR